MYNKISRRIMFEGRVSNDTNSKFKTHHLFEEINS